MRNEIMAVDGQPIMTENFAYPASVKRDEEGFYLVTFADFPECATDGDTREEALYEAADALEEAIAGRINRGDVIPRPSRPRTRQTIVPVPAQMAAKGALYMAVKEAGIRNTELAKRLGADEKEIRRLLDPRHRSKLPRLEAALQALGKKLVIGVQACRLRRIKEEQATSGPPGNINPESDNNGAKI